MNQDEQSEQEAQTRRITEPVPITYNDYSIHILKAQALIKDAEIVVLFQDKEYTEIIRRLSEAADALKHAAIPIATLAFRRNRVLDLANQTEAKQADAKKPGINEN